MSLRSAVLAIRALAIAGMLLYAAVLAHVFSVGGTHAKIRIAYRRGPEGEQWIFEPGDGSNAQVIDLRP